MTKFDCIWYNLKYVHRGNLKQAKNIIAKKYVRK